MSRVYSMRGERMPGFCPMCTKSVDIMISENSVEVFGICLECGNMLFYSHKDYPVENFLDEGD